MTTIAANRAWRRAITDWHGLAADVLPGLAASHAAAALVHHTIWHGGLIGRMAPAAAERPPLEHRPIGS